MDFLIYLLLERALLSLVCTNMVFLQGKLSPNPVCVCMCVAASFGA